MDNFNNINDLCRICMRQTNDGNGEDSRLVLNQTQFEKLTFIGDSRQIELIDNHPPCLCIKCGSKLDLAYDFVLKLRTSAFKIKQRKLEICHNENNSLNHSYADDPLRVIALKPVARELTQNHRDGENAQQTEYFVITKISSPQSSLSGSEDTDRSTKFEFKFESESKILP